MSAEPGDSAREWEADRRDFIADARDAIADERDARADARDVAAAARDDLADARERRLRSWAQRLEARAHRLGLTGEDDPDDAEMVQDAAARATAERDRAVKDADRREAAAMRERATVRRAAKRRDALLAAAFAGIAEYLYESESSEELLTRVAEAAVATITGSSRAIVVIDEAANDAGIPADPGVGAPADLEDAEPVFSIPFSTSLDDDADAGTASLTVFADDRAALDDVAEDIGVILAAHASLAARAIGERVRLERVIHDLEHALSSRDIIGQAKGILMQRLKTTPEGAFDMLRRSSQRLNVKLREVAQTLAETGEMPVTNT